LGFLRRECLYPLSIENENGDNYRKRRYDKYDDILMATPRLLDSSVNIIFISVVCASITGTV